MKSCLREPCPWTVDGSGARGTLTLLGTLPAPGENTSGEGMQWDGNASSQPSGKTSHTASAELLFYMKELNYADVV